MTPEQLLDDPDWVKRNSRWRYWTWTMGMFAWVGFMWIGVRARRRSWVMFGALYSVGFILVIIATETTNAQNESPFDAVAGAALVVVLVASIFHARHVLPEYLAARARIEASPAYGATPADEASRLLAGRRENVERQGPAEHKVVTSAREDVRDALVRPIDSPSAPPPLAAQDQGASSSASPLVDINAATEAELARLPGIGAVLAKRAIDLRKASGGFRSVEAFGSMLGLKPHVVERLRPLVVVGNASTRGEQRGGRIVDF